MTGKRKRVTKRVSQIERVLDEELVGQLVNKRVNRPSFDVIQNAIGEHGDRLTPSQLSWIKNLVKKKYSRGVDLNYLKTVFFPEYFSYDIPQPLTNLAYCRFDDKQEITINTGYDGSGMLIWYPRTTQGPSLFYLPGGAPYWDDPTKTIQLPSQTGIASRDFTGVILPDGTKTSTTTKTKCMDNSQWCYGFTKGYQKCFSQSTLVAGALSIQYTGQVEQEAGLMIGGHIYGITPDSLILDDIDNSQYVTRRRPSDGLRFTYLPADSRDYDYYPTSVTNSHNAGAQPTGGETQLYLNLGSFNVSATNVNTTAAVDMGTPIGTQPGSITPKPTFLGQTSSLQGQGYTEHQAISYSSTTNYVAVYWTGLPANKNWLRIDCIRRFNGIPKQAYRDAVSVSRCKSNFDSKKTFDVLRQMCINTPVGGHSLREIDAQMDKIVTNLPNIVHLAQAPDSLQAIKTMEDLGNALESPIIGSEPRLL